jgi:hypothetical protein
VDRPLRVAGTVDRGRHGGGDARSGHVPATGIDPIDVVTGPLHRRPARHRKDVGLVAQLGGLLVGDVVAHEHDAEADSERAGEDRGEREVAEDPLAQAHAVAL